jgi:hypothetical protein
MFIIRAYQLPLEKLQVGVKWVDDCCRQAVNELNAIGITTTTNAEVLRRWCKEFSNTKKFPHPNPYVCIGKSPKPSIFEHYPKFEAKIRSFVLENLDCFTVEMLRSEISNNMISEFLKDAEAAGETNTLGYGLLLAYKDKPPSYSTVLR